MCVYSTTGKIRLRCKKLPFSFLLARNIFCCKLSTYCAVETFVRFFFHCIIYELKASDCELQWAVVKVHENEMEKINLIVDKIEYNVLQSCTNFYNVYLYRAGLKSWLRTECALHSFISNSKKEIAFVVDDMTWLLVHTQQSLSHLYIRLLRKKGVALKILKLNDCAKKVSFSCLWLSSEWVGGG